MPKNAGGGLNSRLRHLQKQIFSTWSVVGYLWRTIMNLQNGYRETGRITHVSQIELRCRHIHSGAARARGCGGSSRGVTIMKSTLFARIGFAATAGLLFSLVTVSAKADTVTLTMNEVPNQPINGLTVTKGGESFTFSDPIGSLFYNSNGPGTRTFVQDPTIQGPLQSFSVAFSVAVTSIQFGLAELANVPLTGAQVTLSSGDTFLFNLSLVDPFAEGQFTHSGSPVTSFTLTPAPGAFALAFDNLTVTPVPGTIVGAGLPGLILACGVLLVLARRRRRTV
jgi:hypothetical protein